MSFEGLLNTTCTIEKLSVIQDPVSRQKTETWSVLYSNVKCRLDGAEGKEFLGQNKLINFATHILFLPINYKLNMYTHRIKCKGIYFNILQVTDGGGHGHHQEIFLEQRI